MTTKENILKTLKSNKQKLSKFGIRNVGLFGSYLRGEQSSESDIDLSSTLHIRVDFEMIMFYNTNFVNPFIFTK